MTDLASQLYLISPLDVTGAFPDRLARALDAGPVAAFQFRVKDIDEHGAARLAEPLQRICADRDVAFIVNDRSASPSAWAPTGSIWGRKTATWPRPASVWAATCRSV
jgi:thiamine monophosphate synthase